MLQDSLTAAGRELANLFRIGRIVNAAVDAFGAGQQLASSATNLLREFRNGTLSAADVAREVTLIVGQKDELRNAFQTLTENNPVDRAVVALTAALSGLEAAVDRVLALPDECLSFFQNALLSACLLYTSPSPRDQRGSRMPSSA